MVKLLVSCSKEQKLLKTMKFPKEYDLPVNLPKVNMEVMKVWIANRCTSLLNVEDEVLIGYIIMQLEGKEASLL
jgi:serine/arginine repetitive matrix protein 1